MLQTSGFGNIELFYTGLAFRGWVASHNYKKDHETDEDDDAATAGAVIATQAEED
jgi:hypothetical protein